MNLILAQAAVPSPDLAHALYAQVASNPASILLILVVSIVCVCLDRWKQFPNSAILPVALVLGALLYALLVPASGLASAYPHPSVALALIGLVLGFVAWAIHATVIARLLAMLPGSPTLPPASSDTEIVNRVAAKLQTPPVTPPKA